MKDIVGIVLGGGKGTRLFPLTYVRSKPAVPLAGKYRLIDIPISNCINSGISKIFVLTQYNSASLNRHINLTYRLSMFSGGFVDVLAAEQTHESVRWFQGTADAVRQSLRHVLQKETKYVLILSGDQIYRMNYRKLLRQHKRAHADITVSVLPVGIDQGPTFGILKMDGEGQIVDFHEKPDNPELIEALKTGPEAAKAGSSAEDRPLMASMGIYLFRRDVLVKLLEDETKIDFGGQVIPSSLSTCKVMGSVFDGYWEDIGTIRAFYKANLDLCAEKPQFNFYDVHAPIYTHPRFLPATRLEKCTIEESIVSDGCVVGESRISGSVVGIRSIIREHAEIRDSLIMGADYYETGPIKEPIPIGIGAHSSITGAIVDKNARIGRGVRISNELRQQEFDGENYYIRDGIVIIPKDAQVPDGAVI